MDGFKLPVLPAVVAEKKATEVVTAEDAKQPEDTPLAAKKPQQNLVSCETTCPYKMPPWSAEPATDNLFEYKFEVLKSGQIIDEVKQLQTKAVWKFGRLPNNDIEMAHPTISRFHAVLQYRPAISHDADKDAKSEKPLAENCNEGSSFTKGWYIYDLGSTHGTFLNKQRIPPKTYFRIKVGHMLRLGASTRCFILQGPSEDEEPESELTVTELRAQRLQQENERALEAQLLAEAKEREREQAGVSWGMMEDADEEADLTVNPFASTNNEELFLDDPKRTLRGFFDREGLELVYKCDEMSAGSFVCRVELPLDDSNGRPIVVEVIHKGRKKESVVQCALEACRILDRYGVLRQANQEPLKRKTKTADSDDEDDFLDRTGDVERKKLRKIQTGESVTLTYEDLLKQETELLANISKVQMEINKCQDLQKRQKATQLESTSSELDLDSFMQKLDNDADKKLDKIEVRKLRMEEQRLILEHTKLQRLLKVAKPFELSLASTENSLHYEGSTKKSASIKQLPMFGKRNQFTKFKVIKTSANASDATKTNHGQSSINPFSDEELDHDGEACSEPSALKADNNFDTNMDIAHELHSNPDSVADIDADVAGRDYAIVEISPKRKTPNEVGPHHKELLSPAMNMNANDHEANCELEEQSNNESSVAAKKRRHRQRVRNKRTEVDELAAHESTDKYAKWVPPENQTGDGITELNKKFGY